MPDLLSLLAIGMPSQNVESRTFISPSIPTESAIRFRDRSNSTPGPRAARSRCRPQSLYAPKLPSADSISSISPSPLVRSLSVSKSEDTVSQRSSNPAYFTLSSPSATIATQHAQVLTSTLPDNNKKKRRPMSVALALPATGHNLSFDQIYDSAVVSSSSFSPLSGQKRPLEESLKARLKKRQEQEEQEKGKGKGKGNEEKKEKNNNEDENENKDKEEEQKVEEEVEDEEEEVEQDEDEKGGGSGDGSGDEEKTEKNSNHSNRSSLSSLLLNPREDGNKEIQGRLNSPGDMAGSCGIPLATQDRNSDFHALFRSVPENDPLLEDYKCALQKDILLQGHLYITENHICFNANIFGWVTNLVIAFSDITKVEKRMTAMIIPNAIHIYTANGKHVFASFLSRDLAYDQIFQLWQTHKHGQMLQPYIFDFVAKDGDSSSDNNDPESTDSSSFDQPFNLSDARQLFPQCPCCEQNEHYDNILLQESLPGTVDNAFKLLFDSDFVEQYLSKVERLEDVGMGTWYHGSRKNIITTKDTNANSNDNKKSQGDTTNIVIEFKDEQIYCKSPYYMSIITSLQIPDGHRDSLTIKLRTCITRYNSTKVNVLVTFQFGDSKESEQKDHNQYNIKSRMLKDGAGRLSRVLRTKWIQQREEDYVKKRTEDKDKRPSVWNDRILREANLMPLSRVGRLKIRLVEGMKSGGAEMAMSWERLVCLLMNIVSFGLSVRLKERQFVFVLLCFVAAAVVVTNAILVHRLVTPTVATGPSFGLQGALGGDPWGLDQLRSEVIVLQEKISRLKADCERNGLLIPRQ